MSLLDNLISWWSFENSLGDGKGVLPWQNNGSISYVAGAGGSQQVQVGHSTGFLYIPSGSAAPYILRNTSWSVAYWMKLGTNGADYSFLVRDMPARVNSGLLGSTASIATVYLQCWTDVGSGFSKFDYEVDTNLPHHIVVIGNIGTNTIKLYCDNVLAYTETASLYIPELQYISYPDAGAYYTHAGQIDELAVWNRALSASEVSTLYGGGFAFAQLFTDMTRTYAPDPISMSIISYGPSVITRGSATMLHARERKFSLNTRQR